MKKEGLIGILILIVALGFVYFNYYSTTGKVIFNSEELDGGLISHFSFEESAYDPIRKENWPVDKDLEVRIGKVDHCYNFDGEGDLIGIGKPEDFDKSITWSGWAEVPFANKGRVLYERGGYQKGYQIFLDTNQGLSLRYRWNQGDLNYAKCGNETKISDGNWHLITAVIDVDLEKMRLYIDGIKMCEERITPLTGKVDQGAHIGSSGSSSVLLGGYWKGGIDEVNIWNKALNEEEVKQLFNNYVKETVKQEEKSVKQTSATETKTSWWQKFLNWQKDHN